VETKKTVMEYHTETFSSLRLLTESTKVVLLNTRLLMCLFQAQRNQCSANLSE